MVCLQQLWMLEKRQLHVRCELVHAPQAAAADARWKQLCLLRLSGFSTWKTAYWWLHVVISAAVDRALG